MTARHLARLILILLALSLAGCASYYQPRYGHDGVYYDPPQQQYRAVHVDPLLYPYWSLDYFYFGRHYHPYSVLVDFYDPWYAYGPRYRHYQPWGFRYVHLPRYRHIGRVQQAPVRQVDERLRELERRRNADTSRVPRSPSGADNISARRAAAQSGQPEQERRRASSVQRRIQREGIPTRSIPRQEPTRPSAPRQQSRTRHEPSTVRPPPRSAPTSPPVRQSAPPTQRQSPSPRQRSGSTRPRQREREPLR